MATSPMPVDEAAGIYLAAERDSAFAARVKLVAEAKGRLRDWFAAYPAARHYEGRVAVKSATYERFSATRARELLTPEQVEDCIEMTTRRELVPLE